MKARVYEIARQLGLSSKELIERLKALNVKVKSHASSLDEETVEIVKDEIESALRVAGEKRKEKMPLLKVDFPVNVKRLSVKLNAKPAEIIKMLMKHNFFATINQDVDEDVAKKVAEELGYRLVVVAPNVLGVINQTLQTLITAATFRDGLDVAGVVLNDIRSGVDDVSVATNLQELQARCVPPVLAHVGWRAEAFDEPIDWFALAEPRHQFSRPADEQPPPVQGDE